VPDPVGDAERAELGEIAVVEDEQKQTILAADALDGMAMAARKVPDVAGIEVGDLGMTLRIGDRDAALALDDISPFRRVGVPVQLAQRTGLERHQHPCELLRNRKLRNGCLLRPAALPGLR